MIVPGQAFFPLEKFREKYLAELDAWASKRFNELVAEEIMKGMKPKKGKGGKGKGKGC